MAALNEERAHSAGLEQEADALRQQLDDKMASLGEQTQISELRERDARLQSKKQVKLAQQ